VSQSKALRLEDPSENHRQAADRATSAVIGAWELVSIEDRKSNGEVVRWMGANPTGLIIYDASGYMSVQFMRDPRPVFASAYNLATPDEVKNAYEGYFAYFGTYEVDESNAVIIHHLQGSLRPQEVGIEYRRYFEIDGDLLILTMAVPGKDAGRKRTLVWKRSSAVTSGDVNS
jgi:hypothetical protein